VAEDSEFARLKSLGYTRLRDYAGSGVEGGKRGYYSSTVAGANLFHQGIMQTVHRSVFGIDPASGRTLTGVTAGGVPTQMVDVVTERLKAAQRRSESASGLLLSYAAGRAFDKKLVISAIESAAVEPARQNERAATHAGIPNIAVRAVTNTAVGTGK
jgi:hypothetical protein